MFVFDEKGFDVLINSIEESNIVGIECEVINNNVYCFVATPKKHFITSFASDESFLDFENYFKIIVNTSLYSKKICLSWSFENFLIYYNLNFNNKFNLYYFKYLINNYYNKGLLSYNNPRKSSYDFLLNK